MARYQKNYRNQQYLRDKKRDRIRQAVMWAAAILLVGGIAVMGIFQHNKWVVGFTLIFLGIVSGVYALFLYQIQKRGWAILTAYDSDDLRFPSHAVRELREKQVSEVKRVRTVVCVICLLLSLSLPILGILRMLSII